MGLNVMLYRVIKNSLCTWRLYCKHQVQRLFDHPVCALLLLFVYVLLAPPSPTLNELYFGIFSLIRLRVTERRHISVVPGTSIFRDVPSKKDCIQKRKWSPTFTLTCGVIQCTKKGKAVNLSMSVGSLFQLNSCTYTCRSHLTSSCVSHVAPEIVKYDARSGLDWFNVYTGFRKSRQVGSEDEIGVQTVQIHNCTHTAWRCLKSIVFPHNKGKMVKKLLSHNMTPTTGFENNELNDEPKVVL